MNKIQSQEIKLEKSSYGNYYDIVIIHNKIDMFGKEYKENFIFDSCINKRIARRDFIANDMLNQMINCGKIDKEIETIIKI